MLVEHRPAKSVSGTAEVVMFPDAFETLELADDFSEFNGTREALSQESIGAGVMTLGGTLDLVGVNDRLGGTRDSGVDAVVVCVEVNRTLPSGMGASAAEYIKHQRALRIMKR